MDGIDNNEYLIALQALQFLELQRLSDEQRFFINWKLPSEWPLSRIISHAIDCEASRARIARVKGVDIPSISPSISSESGHI